MLANVLTSTEYNVYLRLMGMSFVLQVGYLVIMEAPKCHGKNSIMTSFEPPRNIFLAILFPFSSFKTR